MTTPAIKIKGKPFTGPEYYHYSCPERGDRYFRVNRKHKKVTQVILDPGRLKGGRGYIIGVVEIQLSSFSGSYYWHYGKEQHLIKLGCNPATVNIMNFITQTQFDWAFQRVKQMLKL